MNILRFILLDKDGRVVSDAQHLEEAKHKLENDPTAYAIYDSKRGMIIMLKLEEAIHER